MMASVKEGKKAGQNMRPIYGGSDSMRGSIRVKRKRSMIKRISNGKIESNVLVEGLPTESP